MSAGTGGEGLRGDEEKATAGVHAGDAGTATAGGMTAGDGTADHTHSYADCADNAADDGVARVVGVGGVRMVVAGAVLAV